jgi:hypothetical protein
MKSEINKARNDENRAEGEVFSHVVPFYHFRFNVFKANVIY